MLNVLCVGSSLLIGWGGGLLINKGAPQYRNFIYLIVLLSVWLLVYTLVINKCLNGNIFLLNVLLSSVVILCIKTKSLLIFYIFFELRVIPITLIVFLFGYQPEKLQASLFLLIYTVVRRLPLLLFIVTHERHHFITIVRSVIISVPITMGFIVKTPMFLLHTWLPKAHVEAPVGGSIVLAGVLLKLGSYGLLLFLPLIKLNTLLSFYYGIGLIGSSLGALICLRQGDLKLLIAYSSVVHMGVVTLGFIRATEVGYSCGLIMVLGHGLSSPFIFAFSYWLYESSHSRLMPNNSRAEPIIMGALIALVSLNIGVPPSLSLWSEVLISVSSLHLLRWSFPALGVVFLLGAVYNLYLYTSCIHSKFSVSSKQIHSVTIYPLAQVVFYGYAAFFCLDLFHIFT